MKRNFLAKKKRNKTLIIILCIAGLIIAYNFGKDYLKDLAFSTPTFVPSLDGNQTQKQSIRLNFSILDNLKNVELDDYIILDIERLDPRRKNPYIPYYDVSEETEEIE